MDRLRFEGHIQLISNIQKEIDSLEKLKGSGGAMYDNLRLALDSKYAYAKQMLYEEINGLE